MTGDARAPDPLPRRWRWLVRFFARYCRRYVRSHFHGVRLSRGSASPPAGPALVVVNHPSWWDPLIGAIVADRFTGFEHYAAIDRGALEQYPIFKRLGFAAVHNAASFLRAGRAILSEPNRAFWVAAQGRFADVRERPLNLRPGVGHLAAKMTAGVVLPVAIEYAFWNERTPEAFVRIGEAIPVSHHPGLAGKIWTNMIEDALTRTLDALDAEVASRDPAKFDTILSGRCGVGGVYDLWRRAKARVRGRRFDVSHESVMKERP
ncbi:MAG: lysophospholipid acyltransferase family protein [Gemmataceae bacterium]